MKRSRDGDDPVRAAPATRPPVPPSSSEENPLRWCMNAYSHVQAMHYHRQRAALAFYQRHRLRTDGQDLLCISCGRTFEDCRTCPCVMRQSLQVQ